jgi:hypothetical protein
MSKMYLDGWLQIPGQDVVHFHVQNCYDSHLRACPFGTGSALCSGKFGRSGKLTTHPCLLLFFVEHHTSIHLCGLLFRHRAQVLKRRSARGDDRYGWCSVSISWFGVGNFCDLFVFRALVPLWRWGVVWFASAPCHMTGLAQPLGHHIGLVKG